MTQGPEVAGTRRDDLAVVGMSCVFPGADGVDAFWRNIVENRVCLGEPPPGWDADRYLAGGRITTATGGYLGDLFRVDPIRLGVMPKSIDGGEPDQLLALRVAREALADAGADSPETTHDTTGIILGHSAYLHRGHGNMIQHGVVLDQTVEMLGQLVPDIDADTLARVRSLLADKLPPFNADVAPGLVPNVMTGRIANRLDFKGPNYILDAACASSLLAVGAAMEELQSGRSDLMLAGGVNASIPPEALVIFSQLDGLSHTSGITPFDAAADGTLLGEGLGIVVLKRLADARRDGDRIYAVLKGVGQSSDGRGLGLLAPRFEGERLAFERTYAASDVDPAGLGLIEAHGTGIPLGDRTEVAALRALFGGRVNDLPTCALGSVKANIGHTIPAAGIAGLIKSVLALYYGVLPPMPCAEVNADLALNDTPLYVNTEARPWIQAPDRPRRAGVNAFGFGGVNAHAVLEEFSAESPAPGQTSWPCELLMFAATSQDALVQRVQGLAEALTTGGLDAVPLARIARTTAADVGAGDHRLAVVAQSHADLAAKLDTALDRLAGEDAPALFRTRSGVVYASAPRAGQLAFVFPGEGSQYQGMLQTLLLAFPGARAWFDAWDGAFAGERAVPPSAHVFPPTTTLAETTADALRDGLFGLEIGSESVFVANQACLSVLHQVGLRPNVVAGHSSGENSAIYAAGALGERDPAAAGALMRRLNAMYRSASHGIDGEDDGALMTVGAMPRAKVAEHVDGETVFLALDNCPNQTVLYGPRKRLDRIAESLHAAGGLCAFLNFARPYHTPLFQPVAESMAEVLADVPFMRPEVPLYSGATADNVGDDPDAIRRLATEQWARQVRFTDLVENMYAAGVTTFVEVGPASNLTGFIGDTLRGRPHLAVSLDNRNQDSLKHALQTLGRLWVAGHAIDPAGLFAGRDIAPLAEPWQDDRSERWVVLDNTLPTLALTDAEAAELRARIGPGAGAPTVDPGHAQPAASGRADADATVDRASQPVIGSGATPGTSGPDDQDDTAPGLSDDAMQRHFDLMDRFLGTQERVLQAMLGGGYDGAGSDGAGSDGAYPFLEACVRAHDGGWRYSCELFLDRHTFLHHHMLYTRTVSDLDPDRTGLPVVPFAVSLELCAEAAAARLNRWDLAAFTNVRAHGWIDVCDGGTWLDLDVEPSAGVPETPTVRVVISRGERPLFEACLVFGETPGALRPRLAALQDPRPPQWSAHGVYGAEMFHGPLFQAISEVVGCTDSGIEALLDDTPLAGFFDDGLTPSFVVNPVLLDAVGHATAFWLAERIGLNFSSFPISVARIELGRAQTSATQDCTLRASLEAEGDGQERVGVVKGDFDCLTPDGEVLFRVTGWRDVFFGVPETVARARTLPREGWYGRDLTPLFDAGDGASLIWHVPPFPPAMLDAAGGIARAVIAYTVLAGEELAVWNAFAAGSRRRDDWLMGRLAAKDAARAWLQQHVGVAAMPADIVVRAADSGRPYLTWAAAGVDIPLPGLSIAHAGGHAVAGVSGDGGTIGVDVEPKGRANVDDVLDGAFSAHERERLAAGNNCEADAPAARAWCAKEAVAKSLGEGLTGRPGAFVVQTVAADGEAFTIGYGADGYPVQTRDAGEVIVAATWSVGHSSGVDRPGAAPPVGPTGR